MSITLYTSMLDDVMPDVMGCSVDLAVNALRNAAIELHQKSWIYTQAQDPINVIAGTAEYDLDSFTNYRVVGVTSAYIDEHPITPLALETLARTRRHWELEAGYVEGYLLTDSNVVRLYRIPQAAAVLRMTLALAPTKASTGIETFIYDLYSEGIAAGAKARLMAIPSKPFSNTGASALYRAEFSAVLTDAKWRAKKSLTSANLMVTR